MFFSTSISILCFIGGKEIHIKELSLGCPDMIDVLQAIILGIVQGLTEWLPISSSGHLAILQLAMGLEVPIFFDLILHIGTLTVSLQSIRKILCQYYPQFLHF